MRSSLWLAVLAGVAWGVGGYFEKAGLRTLGMPPIAGITVPTAVALGVLALLSLLGLVAPGMYARESPAWAAQAFGQDWFDLLVAAPWIAVCGAGAATGSVRWRVLLAGGYAYAIYELAIYAFAVHFNALFLVYCATLGLSLFAFVAIVGGAS